MLITTVDGRELDSETLIEDEDGHWEAMGGALCLVAPSAAYEARREAQAKVDADERAIRDAAATYEAAVQGEMRKQAEATLALRGIVKP